MSIALETVEVAVVLILDDEGRLLLDYNDNWNTFTLPMSKRHPVPAGNPDDTTIEEPLETTAVRAAAEVIGRPLLTPPKQLSTEVPPWNQSGRDGQWKRYQYHVFVLRSPKVVQPLPGHTAVWLTTAELESAEPISPTVRAILRAVPFADVKRTVGM